MGLSHGWSAFIVIVTLGGLYALYLLTQILSSHDPDGAQETHVWDEDLTELQNPLPRWWVGLFYITIVFSVVYLLLYPGLGSFSTWLGWSQTGQYEQEVAQANARYGPLFEQFADTPIPALADNPDAVAMGRRLYAAYCTTCHGSDARGVPGFPNLADKDWLWGGTPEAIKTSILDGRNGVMPGWAAVIKNERSIDELTAYVLALSGRTTDPEAAKAGGKHFGTYCVACHGADGTGNTALGAPNLTDSVWLYGATELDVRASIAAGRNGKMPAHRDFLGPDKAHLLAAYVYSLSAK